MKAKVRALSLQEGILLVQTARSAIENHLSGRQSQAVSLLGPNLTRPRGVFVTLLDWARGRELRGCIGNALPERPLLEHASLMAVEAATSDPRFRPIDRSELRSNIVIEVSTLTSPELLRVSKPIDYRELVTVGRDGLIVEGDGQRGLLLPQVAVEEGFDSEEFLSQCCLKAGLLPDAWLTGRVKVWTFQGQVFAEAKPAGEVHERVLASQ